MTDFRCIKCDGMGEWDEGPLVARSSTQISPDYRRVKCPDCNGRGWVGARGRYLGPLKGGPGHAIPLPGLGRDVVEVGAFAEEVGEVLGARRHGDRGSFPTSCLRVGLFYLIAQQRDGRGDWIRTSDPLRPRQRPSRY